MFQPAKPVLALSLSAIALASCARAETVDSGEKASKLMDEAAAFEVTDMGSFAEPWAIAFAPGTSVLFITEQAGTIRFIDTVSGRSGTVSGVPQVDYGGQGGLGDIAFLQSEADSALSTRTIYLSWAEPGDGDTRGAVVGRGQLVCEQADACEIREMDVIWRQAPKVTGRGHYSHRIAFSPDERFMFVASGDRQKLEPAQDNANTLGTIVRLTLDGKPAKGNPFEDKASPTNEIWSSGHRNILGMDFDAKGHLWVSEHGPAGGDELNLIQRGANYGWPTRSYGKHYNGNPIEDHSADDGFVKPALHWTPVIAPGDMIIYSGEMFPAWQGHALVAGLKSEALVRIAFDQGNAREVARYEVGGRLRSVEQGPDGSIWIAEDGENGRVLRLSN